MARPWRGVPSACSLGQASEGTSDVSPCLDGVVWEELFSTACGGGAEERRTHKVTALESPLYYSTAKKNPVFTFEESLLQKMIWLVISAKPVSNHTAPTYPLLTQLSLLPLSSGDAAISKRPILLATEPSPVDPSAATLDA